MNGRTTTSSPSSLGPKADGSPPLRPQPTRTDSARPQRSGKRKVSKGMIKRVEGGGIGMVNNMGWYDAERADTPPQGDPPPVEIPPSEVDPESQGDQTRDEVTANENGELRGIITESPTDMTVDQ